jgi:quercetin dioxygenase-like cupin family protein
MVTNGSISVDQNGEKKIYKAGEAYFEPGDEPHAITADGETMAEYLMFEVIPKTEKGLTSASAGAKGGGGKKK